MNYSQLGTQLHMTRAGARALVLRNIKQLKPYLIYKNKKVVGVSDDALIVIRDFKLRDSKTDVKKDFQIDKLNLKIESLENELKLLHTFLDDKDKQINFLLDDNTKLRATLSQYQNMNFFQRLLGYRK